MINPITDTSIHMANGWLHETPAVLPEHMEARVAHRPVFFPVMKTLLHLTRMLRKSLDRSMLRMERRLCEQLASC